MKNKRMPKKEYLELIHQIGKELAKKFPVPERKLPYERVYNNPTKFGYTTKFYYWGVDWNKYSKNVTGFDYEGNFIRAAKYLKLNYGNRFEVITTKFDIILKPKFRIDMQ